MTAPPQVIRNSDGSFKILNVDIEPMTRVQRVVLAVKVWDQVRALLEVSGEYKERDPTIIGSKAVGKVTLVDKAVAQAAHTDWSAVNKLRPKLANNPEVALRIENGEIVSINDVGRELGMQMVSRLDEGRPSKAKRTHSYYGKGDKFDSAIEPLRRYLRGWKPKDFRFTHVNPKEASRRLKQIDEVMDNLSQAREDLARRSHVATSAAPPEKTRRENS